MRININISEFWRIIKCNIIRFPFAIIFSLLASICFIGLIEGVDSNFEKILFKITIVGIAGISLFTLLPILYELSKCTIPFRILTNSLGLVFLGTYYLQLDESAVRFEHFSFVEYIGIILILHLIISFLPYLFHKNTADFWEYNKQLFANWVSGFLYVIIIFCGLSLAMLAVTELFQFNIREVRYPQLFFIITGLVHVQYFFAHFPSDYRFNLSEINYNRFFINLCKYILIPLISIYFLILYVYGAKIIFQSTLPKGGVAFLILAMSIIGIFTYLLNYRLDQFVTNQLVIFYKKYFWLIFFPLSVLLTVATYRRISDYGVTESRYILASVTAWLVFMAVYFSYTSLKNRESKIAYIPISLAFFVLFTCFGPWNATNVSIKNQSHRMIKIAKSYGLDAEGKFDFSKKMKDEDKNSIRSILFYLSDYNLEEIIDYLPDHLANSKELDIYKILAAWDINSSDYDSFENSNRVSYQLYRNNYMYNEKDKINISGYNYMIPFDYYSQNLDNYYSIHDKNLCEGKSNKVLANLSRLDALIIEFYNKGNNINMTESYWVLNDSIALFCNSVVLDVADNKSEISSFQGFILKKTINK